MIADPNPSPPHTRARLFPQHLSRPDALRVGSQRVRPAVRGFLGDVRERIARLAGKIDFRPFHARHQRPTNPPVVDRFQQQCPASTMLVARRQSSMSPHGDTMRLVIDWRDQRRTDRQDFESLTIAAGIVPQRDHIKIATRWRRLPFRPRRTLLTIEHALTNRVQVASRPQIVERFPLLEMAEHQALTPNGNTASQSPSS